MGPLFSTFHFSTDKMAVINVTYESDLEKFLNGSTLVVVHFAAQWAPQCRQMEAVLTELAMDPQLTDRVTFLQVEAESLPEVSQKYDVTAVPTFILFRNKRKVAIVNGSNAPELTKTVREYAQTGESDMADAPKSVLKATASESLDNRLKSLVNKAPIMVFMKGDRKNPQCGFSKQLVAILNDIAVEYDTFDILHDEEVRQRLKTYSNWPTYPQLYVAGDLVGGLDIVKELKENGELLTTLQPHQ